MLTGFRFALAALLAFFGASPQLGAQAVLLPPEINTEFDELAPLLSADGGTLFFSRRNHPQNFGQRNAEDIWVAYRQPDGSWSRAVNMGAPLNSRGNNRLVGVDPNETNYYFLADTLSDMSGQPTGLFLSKREGRSLGPAEPVAIAGFINVAPKADFHLGPEERVIIMAIRDAASYGSRDLYLSRRQPDGSWGPPRNLGPVINSAVDEGSPFLAADRRSLYFCRQVSGALTFYVSRRTDDSWTNWTAPEKIPLPDLDGAPGPDFALTVGGDAVILPVIGRSGQFDLYQFPLPPSLRPQPVAVIQGSVLFSSGKPATTPDLVYYHRDDPRLVTTRTPLRPDGRFALLTAYGRNMVLFADAAPLFCPAECLNLTGQPCQIPDQEQVRIIEDLFSMPDYVDRETIITDLFQRRQRTFEALNDLDLKLHAFDGLTAIDVAAPVLDSILDNNAALKELAAAYQANFRGSSLTIKGVPATPGPEPDEQEKRFMMLRQRFRERYLSQRDTSSAEMSAVPMAPSSMPETFSAFCGQLWEHSIRRLTPGLRSSLEREALERQLELLRANRSTPSGLIAFLEQHQQNAASTATEGQATIPPAPYPEEWLEELRLEVEPILRDALTGELTAKIRPLAAAHVGELIQEFRRSREYATLDQEFRNRLQQQMDLEKNLLDRNRGSGPPPTGAEPASTAIPPGFQLIEQSLTLEPVRANTRFLLPAVTFEPNAAAIQPAALRELDRLVALLDQEPQLSVRIMAHTHGYMTHLRARQLTTARAQKVAEYLTGRGIDGRRLLPEGMGKMDPLVSNASGEGRNRNQRLEIMLIYME